MSVLQPGDRRECRWIGSVGSDDDSRRVPMLVMVIAPSGCVVIRRNETMDTEKRLVRAGFQVESGDVAVDVRQSPTRPLQIVRQMQDGHPLYTYADPDGCRCRYVGDQGAYQRYEYLLRRDDVAAVLSAPLL